MGGVIIYAYAQSDGIDLQFTPSNIKKRLFHTLIVFDLPANTIVYRVDINQEPWYMRIISYHQSRLYFKINLKKILTFHKIKV